MPLINSMEAAQKEDENLVQSDRFLAREFHENA
jgi:hypothetical protein